jgi:hypothetical protein
MKRSELNADFRDAKGPVLGWAVPDRALDILDGVLVAAALLFVVAPLLFGRDIPGGLSRDGLLLFWVLVFARTQLRGATPRARWWARILPVRSPALESVLVGVVFLLIYLGINGHRVWPSGDTIPSKLLPISILSEHNLDLGEFVQGISIHRRYGLFRMGDQFLSAYPPGAALTALPIYALFSVLFPSSFSSWRWVYAIESGDDLPNVANLMEQYSSALIAALAVVVFFRFSLAVTRSRGLSLWLAAAYGLGTPLLSTGSLGLWQHAPACLFLGLTFLLLLKAQGGEIGRIVLAGLCAGWVTVCRPTGAVILAPVFLWVVKRFRWRASAFALACGVVVSGLLVWNRVVYGSFMGGYGQAQAEFVPFRVKVLLSLLFSPSRGLFVFSPFLLFALVKGLRHVFRSPLDLPSIFLYGAAATVVLFACWDTWAGGACFGSRYLCEAALLLCMILPYGVRALARQRVLWNLFVFTVLLSCHIHILGARWGDREWTVRVHAGHWDDLATLWSWRDSQIRWTLMGAPKP